MRPHLGGVAESAAQDPNGKSRIRALPALAIISQDGEIHAMAGSHAVDVRDEVVKLLDGVPDDQPTP